MRGYTVVLTTSSRFFLLQESNLKEFGGPVSAQVAVPKIPKLGHHTSSTSVTLSLTYSDNTSGVSEVRYSNDGVWDSEAWEPPSDEKTWALTSGDGPKTVYFQVKDNAGLTSLFSANINLGPGLAVSVSPNSKSVGTGQSVTFTASASGGTAPYSYQWYEGSIAVSGGTSDHLAVTKSSAGSYSYYCEVTDSDENTASSNTASLSVTSSGSTTGPTTGPTDRGADSGESTSLYLYAGVVVAIAAISAILALALVRRRKKPSEPEPAQLRITAEPSTLVADGNTKSTITVQLLDKKGNPISAISDTQVQISASNGKLEKPTVVVPAGKDAEQTVIVSSREPGEVPVSAEAKGLKGVTITLNFLEKKRYCMHCGALMPSKARACKNCGKAPPAGVDTKVCHNCKSVIPVVAKFCSECGSSQKMQEPD
jgi:RNA polymerase subunit RPABC4/transcription elongation factor Spt4